MVSQDQSKYSGSKKNGGKELGMVTPQDKPLKKMKFVSSAEKEPSSTTTISEDSKSGRGMSTIKGGKDVALHILRCSPTLVCWHAPESHLWTRNGLKSPMI
ncbi:unnamed protein product [Prunus armeniaca]